MSMPKPWELSRKRQILSPDVQKHQGQSVWLADLWWLRHTEPGRVLDRQMCGGTEKTSWTQGQSCAGVNRAKHDLTHSICPGWGPDCSLCVMYQAALLGLSVWCNGSGDLRAKTSRGSNDQVGLGSDHVAATYYLCDLTHIVSLLEASVSFSVKWGCQ